MFDEKEAIALLIMTERRLNLTYPPGAIAWAAMEAPERHKRLFTAIDWIDTAAKKRNMSAFRKSLELYENTAEALFSAYRHRDDVVPEQGNLLEGVV